ncbi:MAG TPA: DUF3489 domain-containing protein [Bryobacteraceae bacterium]
MSAEGKDESRTNKKAKVIALIKRPKGVTLAEIMQATGWQKHIGPGFRQHPSEQGRRENRILKERRRGTDVSDRVRQLSLQRAARWPGGFFFGLSRL